jgi:hypothetical protein
VPKPLSDEIAIFAPASAVASSRAPFVAAISAGSKGPEGKKPSLPFRNPADFEGVVQYNLATGESLRVYRSAKEAAAFMNIALNGIHQTLQGMLWSSSSGYGWRYYQGPPIDWTALGPSGHQFPLEATLQCGNKSATIGLPVEQLHMRSGQVLRLYLSRAEAAAFMGVHVASIALCCRGTQSHAYGYKWRYYQGPPIDWEAFKKDPRQLSLEKIIQVKNFAIIEQLHTVTGEVLRKYRTAEEAAESMGVSGLGIINCLIGKQDSCRGFKWRYYEGFDIDWAALEHNLKQLPFEHAQRTKAAGMKHVDARGSMRVNELSRVTHNGPQVVRSRPSTSTPSRYCAGVIRSSGAFYRGGSLDIDANACAGAGSGEHGPRGGEISSKHH